MAADESDHVASFRAMAPLVVEVWSMITWVAIGIMLIGVLLKAPWVVMAIVVALLVSVVQVLVVFMPVLGTVDIGRQGVLFHSPGQSQLFELASISGAKRYRDCRWRKPPIIGVELTLKTGEVVKIPVGSEQWFSGYVNRMSEQINGVIKANVASASSN